MEELFGECTLEILSEIEQDMDRYHSFVPAVQRYVKEGEWKEWKRVDMVHSEEEDVEHFFGYTSGGW